ncbi:S8 family serine peptidase [Streptomyces sp. NPDC013157]|uniref:cyanobactin maturation protease PatG family protein n=1 Tax=Streptomyces sp. NPDC013157 TaxID=3364861 RepID=UPI0036AD07EC
MDVRSVLGGLPGEATLLGDPAVRVAVLDGPVDFTHPCFAGADLKRLTTLVTDAGGTGSMSLHGTHVTSLLFGQPGSPVAGLVPRCRGLLLPVFRDSPDGRPSRVPQLDLARAVEQAVEAGAHVINISGGERSADGRAEAMLARALRLCEDSGVLVVAAVGNDGCDCLQAPAATPSVLAVGATDGHGDALDINNWGAAYRANGVLAPGRDIAGAAPGGQVVALTGTSFATPVVTGVAALLVARQIAEGSKPDPLAAGRAILAAADRPPCGPDDAPRCRRLLGGRLNTAQAFDLISKGSPVVSQATRGVPANIAGEPLTPRATPAESKGRAIVMDTNAVHAHAGETAESMSAAAALPSDTGATPSTASNPAPTLPPMPQTAPAMAPPPAEAPGQALPAPPPEPGSLPQGFRQAGTETAGYPGQPTAQPMTQPIPQAAAQAAAQSAPQQAPPPPAAAPAPIAAAPVEQGVRPSCPDCGGTCGGRPSAGTTPSAEGRQLIFAIGTIGFDYQTEARRDSFRQQMPVVTIPPGDGHPEQELPPNVYDPRQVHDYLAKNPWASDKLTWTLNMDATPIYALEAEASAGMDWTKPIISDRTAAPDTVRGNAEKAVSEQGTALADLVEALSYPPVSTVYRTFRDAIVGQIQDKKTDAYVSRVSIPGVLTGRTVRLFSGQVVPVIEVKSRGLYTWNENVFVENLVAVLTKDPLDPLPKGQALDPEALRRILFAVLDKIYYQFRNLGQSSADRALNFAATNAFLVGKEIGDVVAPNRLADHPGNGSNHPYALDTIRVSKSPFCRTGSDCQDVVFTFFDPENDRRANVSLLFTCDVSDELPVTLAPVHHFIGGY